LASVFPDALPIVIAAPAATAPPAIPMVRGRTVRSASALTVTPPPARVIAAPPPPTTEAVWLASVLTTKTWAPTATKPPPAVNAMPETFSTYSASMTTELVAAEPAVIWTPLATEASTTLLMFRTRIDPPTATKPPWTAPAMPFSVSRSSARIATPSPAMITAPARMRAFVPPDGGAATALVTTVVDGAAAVMPLFAAPVSVSIRSFVGSSLPGSEVASMISL
jgi:hypothetical protein